MILDKDLENLTNASLKYVFNILKGSEYQFVT